MPRKPLVSFRMLLTGLFVGCTVGGLLDSDGDGSPDAEDCAPDDSAQYPNAADPFGNDVDENCDGVDGTDVDGDGYPADDGIDCNDLSASVNPGASENCNNGGDEDCDGLIDAADPDCADGDDDDVADDDDADDDDDAVADDDDAADDDDVADDDDSVAPDDDDVTDDDDSAPEANVSETLALHLAGDPDSVEIPFDSSYSFSGDFTVEAWIRTQTASVDHQPAVEHSELTSGSWGWKLFEVDEIVRFELTRVSLAGYPCSGTTVVTDEVWHHIAGVRSGSQLRLFVDGAEENVCSASTEAITTTNGLAVGFSPRWNYQWSDGQIDDVRLWSVARTQTQIEADMDLPLTGIEAGLVGYWPMDGDAADLSQTGSDGVPQGSASFEPWP